jgi:cell division septation protein DedD
MTKPIKLAKPSKFSIKLKDGVTKLHPTYNLSSNRKWMDSYKLAFDKLAQDIRVVLDPKVTHLIERIGDYYEREYGPDYFTSAKTTKNLWLQQAIDDPMKAASVLDKFGIAMNAPVFSQMGYLLAKSNGENIESVGSLRGLETPSIPSRDPASDALNRVYGLDVAGTAASYVPGVPAPIRFAAPYIAEGFHAAGVGSGEQRFEKPVSNEQQVVHKFIPALDALLSKFEAKQQLYEVSQVYGNLSPEEAAKQPTVQHVIKRIELFDQKAKEAISGISPEVRHFNPKETPIKDRLFEGASDLTNVLVSPLFGGGFTGFKRYQRGQQDISSAVASLTSMMSPADSRMDGKVLATDIGDLKAGTTITPEIRTKLQSIGNDIPVTSSDSLPKLQNLLKSVQTGALSHFAGSKGGQLMRATKMTPAGILGRITSRVPGSLNKAKDAVLRASSVVRATAGAYNKLSSGAKFLFSSVGKAASKAASIARLTKIVSAVSKLSKLSKAMKVVPVIGTAVGAAADALSAVVFSSTEVGRAMEDEALKNYALARRNYGNLEGTLRTLGSVPLALIDPQPLRNRLEYAYLGGENNAWIKSQVQEAEYSTRLLENVAASMSDMSAALPDLGAENLHNLAYSVGLNRTDTMFGRRPASREISEYEGDLLKSLPQSVRPLAQDLIREAGPEAVYSVFFMNDSESQAPVIDRARVTDLYHASKKGTRFRSKILEDAGVTYEEPAIPSASGEPKPATALQPTKPESDTTAKQVTPPKTDTKVDMQAKLREGLATIDQEVRGPERGLEKVRQDSFNKARQLQQQHEAYMDSERTAWLSQMNRSITPPATQTTPNVVPTPTPTPATAVATHATPSPSPSVDYSVNTFNKWIDSNLGNQNATA